VRSSVGLGLKFGGDFQELGHTLADEFVDISEFSKTAAIQQHIVTALKREPQSRYRETLGGGGTADRKSAEWPVTLMA